MNANQQFGMIFKTLTKSITPIILLRLIALFINLKKLSNNFHSGQDPYLTYPDFSFGMTRLDKPNLVDMNQSHQI